jgi:flagellar basal-body rod modification protein FlgD
MVAQTAQFTLVEKMDALAVAQESMLESSQLQSATGLVGSSVSWITKDSKDADVTNAGVVTGVSITGGVPTLLVGDKEVALSAVTKVTKAS